LKVTGNNYDIGYQIGSHFKLNIRNILSELEEFKKHKISYPENKVYLSQMVAISKKICPEILEEVQGMADGSGLEFIDLFIHNSRHMPYWSNCSTSVLREDAIHIVHNEDAHPIFEKYAYFVLIQPKNPKSIPFFSHCYPGIIPGMSFGFNMMGLVQTCNALPDPTKSVGLPRMFVGRTIYEKSKTITDAIHIIAAMKPRSGGASYTLCTLSEQNIVNVETTGTDFAVIPIKTRFFRANHYISEKFKHFPAASEHTLRRQRRGDELLPKIHNSKELVQIMRDKSIHLTMESTNNECQTNALLHFKITQYNIEVKIFPEFSVQSHLVLDLEKLKSDKV